MVILLFSNTQGQFRKEYVAGVFTYFYFFIFKLFIIVIFKINNNHPVPPIKKIMIIP